MADIKKEQEREELHRAIWAIADELRGSVDGWDFKSYVLGTMFYRYISENLTEYINAGEIAAGNNGFDYARLSDAEAEEAREGLVQEKGFFMLPSELFCNVRARASQDENLNETLEKVFHHIEDSAKGSSSEHCFSGLFDDFDVNSNKLGATVAKRNEKLVKLLNGIGGMNLGAVRGHSIDAFGDAYEFLMTMYASNAGKSGGEFFTPSDVSELLTRLGTVGKAKVNKVYDPACGSGSLLLKATKVLGKDGVQFGYFGQEINITTYNLCRINMFLHDVGFDKFDIACEDTLTAPQHWDDEPFELIVSNPPYSIKWAGDDDATLINDPRFAPAGVLAPKSKADLAFIMHALSWLASNGTAAIVCFPGIMYRGGAEQKIRKYLVDNNLDMFTNDEVSRPIDECPDFVKYCPPKSKNDKAVLLGIEHFQVDQSSIRKKSGKMGATVNKYQKEDESRRNIFEAERKQPGKLTDRAISAFATSVSQSLQKWYNAEYAKYIESFRYSLEKHLPRVDAYLRNISSISKGRFDVKLAFLVEIYSDFRHSYLTAHGSTKLADDTFIPIFEDIVQMLERIDAKKVQYIVLCFNSLIPSERAKVIALNTKNLRKQIVKQHLLVYNYAGEPYNQRVAEIKGLDTFLSIGRWLIAIFIWGTLKQLGPPS